MIHVQSGIRQWWGLGLLQEAAVAYLLPEGAHTVHGKVYANKTVLKQGRVV